MAGGRCGLSEELQLLVFGGQEPRIEQGQCLQLEFRRRLVVRVPNEPTRFHGSYEGK